LISGSGLNDKHTSPRRIKMPKARLDYKARQIGIGFSSCNVPVNPYF